MDDIPRRVRDRPSFAPLSPEDEQEFLRKQAGFETAYGATGDPQALCQAFLHVYASRQTPPLGGMGYLKRPGRGADR
jgi:hypothetical protein